MRETGRAPAWDEPRDVGVAGRIAGEGPTVPTAVRTAEIVEKDLSGTTPIAWASRAEVVTAIRRGGGIRATVGGSRTRRTETADGAVGAPDRRDREGGRPARGGDGGRGGDRPREAADRSPSSSS